MIHNLSVAIELAGAALILLAFWANSSGRWPRESRAYLWVNLAGGLLLGYIAYTVHRWGFVLLEVVWVGISISGLLHRPPAEETTSPVQGKTLTEDRTRLLELVKTKSVLHGHFLMSSGQERSYDLDDRQVTLSAEGGYLSGKLLHQLLAGLDVQAVGGLTMGADPLAAAVSLASYQEGSPIPAFLVRKETKTHSKQQMVEGPLPKGARVAIVADTVTTGASLLQAVAVVEALGCTVAIVLCLVDRLEGARERIEGMGYRFESLYTIRDLGIEG